MANVRWKDKSDITTLAVDDYIPVIDKSASNEDKYCTPAEIAVSVFDQGGTLGAKLTAGAIEIEGSNFDINGGAIDDATLGANVAIKEAQVDNINIDGNTISSTDTNGDINLTPNGTGEVVIGAGNISYAGTAITATGAELNYVDGVASQLAGLTENHAQNYVTATASTVALTSNEGVVNFDTTSNAITATLPAITTGKSEEYVLTFGTDGGNNVTIADAAGDAGFVKADGTTTGTSITLNDEKDFVYLKSPSIAGAYWMILGGQGYALA